MRNRESKSVVALSPASKNATPVGVDQLGKAGQTILHLLNEAADVTEQNSRHALDMAQKLSHQLRAAERRIALWRRMLVLFKTKLTERSNGFTRSAQKSKTGFCGKTGAGRSVSRIEVLSMPSPARPHCT